MCSTEPGPQPGPQPGLASSDASAETTFPLATPLKYMYDHEYLGIVHGEGTHDFETYVVTQPVDAYAPAVMQGVADEATLRLFVSPSTTPDIKLRILTQVLSSFIDRRLFITSPQPVYDVPEACSLILLCVTGQCLSDNRVLAVCDVVSRPVLQGAGDALTHVSLAPQFCEAVMQVVVRAVFPGHPTWWECVEYPLPDLDAHYRLDELTKAMFQMTVDQCLHGSPTFISLLTKRTHHSAHQAFAFSAYMPNRSFADECVLAACPAYQPYARAFLLGRMLSMPSIKSQRPDYEQLCAVITTGIRELRCVVLLLCGPLAWF